MHIIRKITFIFILIHTVYYSFGQDRKVYTRQDSLRGAITKERAWWDLTYYDLKVSVRPSDSSISGTNSIYYRVLTPYQKMQIELQKPMKITSIIQNGQTLNFTREGSVYFIYLKDIQEKNELNSLTIEFNGQPKVSELPPWKGGITWSKDKNGNDFIANSNQGEGASVWWPCKDHPYDEPDSIQISLTVPQNLTGVSNGRLRKVVENDDATKTFIWFVSNPINNYGVNLSVADYAHFSEVYDGEKGPLDCNYYVLSYNLNKATKQFRQVPEMLEAFEYWFGPYPFYEDGYKLVEVPYLGMEHQSCVTYGNGYENGYHGTDYSSTGWGMKFDFIIIHESGHEWFANNITNRDVADMWIHESFTSYSENLFLNYHYGKKASSEYVQGVRLNILNDQPIVGKHNLNQRGSGDMYAKGANMLHIIRQIVNDDEKWRSVLRGLNKEFYHQTVTGQQIESYIIQQTGLDLQPIFDQYLRDIRIPTFEYSVIGKQMMYRWSNCLDEFNMPVRIFINQKAQWLQPKTEWKVLNLNNEKTTVSMDPNFYISNMILINK